MENVLGLVSMDGGQVLDEILRTFRDNLKYATTVMVLDAANYGVPQYRRRVFLVGHRDGEAPAFPVPTHGLPDNTAKRRSIRGDARELHQMGLPFDEDSATPKSICIQEDLRRYLVIKANNLRPAVTVRDAIADLPKTALLPRDTNTSVTYPPVPHSDYSESMKGGSQYIWNHAAKRHMLRRMMAYYEGAAYQILRRTQCPSPAAQLN